MLHNAALLPMQVCCSSDLYSKHIYLQVYLAEISKVLFIIGLTPAQVPQWKLHSCGSPQPNQLIIVSVKSLSDSLCVSYTTRSRDSRTAEEKKEPSKGRAGERRAFVA